MERLKEFEPFWQEWYIDEKVETGNFCDIFKLKKQTEDEDVIYKALKVIEIPRLQATASSGNLGERRQALHGYFGEIVKVVEEEIKALHVLNEKSNILPYEAYEILERKETVGYDILLLTSMHKSFISYISGKKLEDNSDIIQMAKDICRGLSEIHKMDFLHRDLKLENIYMDDEGNYYLGEIGIENRISTFQTGSVKRGPYEYLAPEVYLNKEYSKKADIYSLGVIIYILCNDGKIPKELQRRDKSAVLPTPCKAKERLSEIIFKAMSYEIKERYDSAESMLEDLETLTEEEIAFPIIEKEEIEKAIDETVEEDVADKALEEDSIDTVQENIISFSTENSHKEADSQDFDMSSKETTDFQDFDMSSTKVINSQDFDMSSTKVINSQDFDMSSTKAINSQDFDMSSTKAIDSQDFDMSSTKAMDSQDFDMSSKEVIEESDLKSEFVEESDAETGFNYDVMKENWNGSGYGAANEILSGNGLDITEQIIFGNHSFGVSEENIFEEYTEQTENFSNDSIFEKQFSNVNDGDYNESLDENTVELLFDIENDIKSDRVFVDTENFTSDRTFVGTENSSLDTAFITEKNVEPETTFVSVENFVSDAAVVTEKNVEPNTISGGSEDILSDTLFGKKDELEEKKIAKDLTNVTNVQQNFATENIVPSVENNILLDSENVQYVDVKPDSINNDENSNFDIPCAATENIVAIETETEYSTVNENSNPKQIMQNVEQQYYNQFSTKTINSTINMAMQTVQEEREKEQEQRLQEIQVTQQEENLKQKQEEVEQKVILKPATPKPEEGEVILKPASSYYSQTSFTIPTDSKKDVKEHTAVKKYGDFWKNTPAVGTYVDDMQEPIEIPIKVMPKKKKKTGVFLAILFVIILAAVVIKILYSNGTIDLNKEKKATMVEMAYVSDNSSDNTEEKNI